MKSKIDKKEVAEQIARAEEQLEIINWRVNELIEDYPHEPTTKHLEMAIFEGNYIGGYNSYAITQAVKKLADKRDYCINSCPRSCKGQCHKCYSEKNLIHWLLHLAVPPVLHASWLKPNEVKKIVQSK